MSNTSQSPTQPRVGGDDWLPQRAPPGQTAVQRLPQSRGIVISDLASLTEFAKVVHDSKLAPKGLDSWQAVALAVQHGLELGLLPAQALSSILVVNGRAAAYGDAVLAIIEGSGLLDDFEEWYELGGKRVDSIPVYDLTTYPNDLTAVCSSKRAGKPRPIVTRFSVYEAKQAFLWGGKGPWSGYPARMLKWRARNFNLRDNFPDVLRGMKTVEEVMDYDPMTGEVQPPKPAPQQQAPPPSNPVTVDAAPAASAPPPPQQPAPSAAPQSPPVDPVTASTPERQQRVDRISALLTELNIPWENTVNKLRTKYGADNLHRLTDAQQEEILAALVKFKADTAAKPAT